MTRQVTRRHVIDQTTGPIKAVSAQAELAKIVATFKQWAGLRKPAATTADRLLKLRDVMKPYVDINGVPDADGHKVIAFPEPIKIDGLTYVGIRNERRRTTRLDEEKAAEILKKKGLYDKATVTVTSLDQDKIFGLYQDEKITDEEIADIFVTETTWAFKPDKAV